MEKDSIDYLKTESFYAIYTICRNGEGIPGWIDVFNVICKKNKSKFKSQNNWKWFKSYHETTLLKYWEAKYILDSEIRTDLFFGNPSFYTPINQKSDFAIECYSKHVQKRAFFLGSYFWALLGTFDMLDAELNILSDSSNFNPSINFERLWKEKEWFKQLGFQRNMFTHNPYFFHVLKGNQQFLLKLNENRLDPAEVGNIIENYNKSGNDEKIMDKPIIEYCDNLFRETTETISEVYSHLLNKISNLSDDLSEATQNIFSSTSTSTLSTLFEKQDSNSLLGV